MIIRIILSIVFFSSVLSAAPEATHYSCPHLFAVLLNRFSPHTTVRISLNEDIVNNHLPGILPAQPPTRGGIAAWVFHRKSFFRSLGRARKPTGNETEITTPKALAQAIMPQKWHNFILTGSELILAEAGSSLGKDLLSKHISLAENDLPVRFAGSLFFDGDKTIYLTNASGTYRPTSEQLEQMAQLVRAQFPFISVKTIDQITFGDLLPHIKKADPATFERSSPDIIDIESDIHLLAEVKRYKAIKDQKKTTEWKQLYREKHANRAGGENTVGTYEIGKERPFEAKPLTDELIRDVIEKSSYPAFIGPEPVWSPQAKLALKSLISVGPSKLLTALSMGKTRQFLSTGLEEQLENRILGFPDRSVGIKEFFREAYELTKGDLFKALLLSENVLTKGAHEPNRDLVDIQQKLKYIRNDSEPKGDNYGAWYHFFGSALYTLHAGWLKSRIVVEVESLHSRRISPPDRQEELINRLGVNFGYYLKDYVDKNERRSQRGGR